MKFTLRHANEHARLLAMSFFVCYSSTVSMMTCIDAAEKDERWNILSGHRTLDKQNNYSGFVSLSSTSDGYAK